MLGDGHVPYYRRQVRQSVSGRALDTRRWSWCLVAVTFLAAGCGPDRPGWVAPSAAPEIQLQTLPSNPDPAIYVAQVNTQAKAAGIDAQLLMAILYNESYK